MLQIPECLLSEKKSRTTTNSEIETKQFHERYLMAVNSLLRGKILSVLNKGNATIEELAAKTGFDETTLKWHLGVLESGFCIEKEDRNIDLQTNARRKGCQLYGMNYAAGYSIQILV